MGLKFASWLSTDFKLVAHLSKQIHLSVGTLMLMPMEANVLRKVATMLGLNLSKAGRVSLTTPQRINKAPVLQPGVSLLIPHQPFN